MNCYFHPEESSVVQCKGCRKQLCRNCHDIEHPEYCFVCSLENSNRNVAIPEKKKIRGGVNHRILQVIGWYEIVGGLFGLLVIVLGAANIGLFNNLYLAMIYLVFLLLFMLSIAAGVLMVLKKKAGRKLTIFIQILQVPQFIVKGTYYSFCAGAQLSLQFFGGMESGFRLNIGIFSEFKFYINTIFYTSMVSINIIPLLVIYFILKSRRKAETMTADVNVTP
ncbi:hypothetical protein [Paenibacillus mendelii]|uniref:B box-type domain-containing protein n=1 Tax=Paenibacillus mendelii TaxID=206163 RepID=A0ABV6JER2_9BACL|nr:hypothetical protein [Paenibacillus mendelii]MCQ6557221.1 hypothetical protein [Paenibacillus mendelii]